MDGIAHCVRDMTEVPGILQFGCARPKVARFDIVFKVNEARINKHPTLSCGIAEHRVAGCEPILYGGVVMRIEYIPACSLKTGIVPYLPIIAIMSCAFSRSSCRISIKGKAALV